MSFVPDFPVLLLGALVMLPALGAARRRQASRRVSMLAGELAEFAAAVRRAQRVLPLEDSLRLRLLASRLVEAAPLQLAQELNRDPRLVAESAQRLALRLRRRVAFERMMLARTAPGLRRGAFMAAVPIGLLWLLPAFGMSPTDSARVLLLVLESAGCALHWRLAQVEL